MQSEARPRITLIAARARNGVIGHNNTLPWRLPEDLQHFKATTLGHVLLMGRKTFDSIGRPLPGRRTIVLTRDSGWSASGVETARSLDEALEIARTADQIFIAGGEQIYRAAMSRAGHAVITEVEIDTPGDAFFPELAAHEWSLESQTHHQSASGLGYSIAHYRRTGRSNTAL